MQSIVSLFGKCQTELFGLVSDRCSRGQAQDTSGPNLVQLITQADKYVKINIIFLLL